MLYDLADNIEKEQMNKTQPHRYMNINSNFELSNQASRNDLSMDDQGISNLTDNNDNR